MKIFGIFVALMLLLCGAAFAQDAADEGAGAATSVEVTADETETEQVEVEEAETEEVEAEEIEEAEPLTEEQVEAEVEAEIEAAEAGEIGQATEEDVKVMTEASGVEVRLLQLQERIERNILHGEEIIAELSTEGKDVAELESILAGLISLKDEAAAADTTGTVKDVTAEFVAMKRKAIDLTKQFRDKARNMVKAEKRAKLKERIKAKEAEQLGEIREKVSKAVKEHNAKVLSGVLARLGEKNPELVEQIKAGEIEIKEAKVQVKQEFRKLSEAKKTEAKLKIKETVSEAKVKRVEAMQNLKAKGLERALSRIENRLNIRETEGLLTARERIRANIAAKTAVAVNNADAEDDLGITVKTQSGKTVTGLVVEEVSADEITG